MIYRSVFQLQEQKNGIDMVTRHEAIYNLLKLGSSPLCKLYQKGFEAQVNGKRKSKMVLKPEGLWVYYS